MKTPAQSSSTDCDVIVIGGGPAGALTAMLLARQGIGVIVIEKADFPRFQIGESFLPATFEQLDRLGLLEVLKKLPHMRKIGAAFGMGNSQTLSTFRFSTELTGESSESFNIARADFDQMMLEQARSAGAIIEQPVSVRAIEKLTDGHVSIRLDDGRCLSSKYLVDASGHQAIVARHLGTKRKLTDSHLQKIACFNHFTNVERLAGEEEGMPIVVMSDEGWFWIIPLNDQVTSVGMVLSPSTARSLPIAADRLLQWGIARCPQVAGRMKVAQGPSTNLVRADFSYRCDPFAGPGYFLVGDAAMFLDPVFSTGVCAGLNAAEMASHALAAILRNGQSPDSQRRKYLGRMLPMMRWFTRMVQMYYDHRFRDMLLEGKGPMKVHQAVLALLAGHLSPRPAFAVRWRLLLFELLLRLNRLLPLVPGRERFSLLSSSPQSGERTHESDAAHADGHPRDAST